MGEQCQCAAAATGRPQADANRMAHGVQRDFSCLVAICDRQLNSLTAADELMRAHFARARAAAAQGLKLSQDLIDILGR
jgi:hypothetical protein